MPSDITSPVILPDRSASPMRVSLASAARDPGPLRGGGADVEHRHAQRLRDGADVGHEGSRRIPQLAHLEQEALRLRPTAQRLHVGEGGEHPLLEPRRLARVARARAEATGHLLLGFDGLGEADGGRAGQLLRALHGGAADGADLGAAAAAHRDAEGGDRSLPHLDDAQRRHHQPRGHLADAGGDAHEGAGDPRGDGADGAHAAREGAEAGHRLAGRRRRLAAPCGEHPLVGGERPGAVAVHRRDPPLRVAHLAGPHPRRLACEPLLLALLAREICVRRPVDGEPHAGRVARRPRRAVLPCDALLHALAMHHHGAGAVHPHRPTGRRLHAAQGAQELDGATVRLAHRPGPRPGDRGDAAHLPLEASDAGEQPPHVGGPAVLDAKLPGRGLGGGGHFLLKPFKRAAKPDRNSQASRAPARASGEASCGSCPAKARRQRAAVSGSL
jgi:hypothetical protein